MKPASLLGLVKSGDTHALARCISIIENETEGYKEILSLLENNKQVPLIGITGPAGAGKSTLINALITELTNAGKKVGVIAVDPSSPVSKGALLGDRVRMAEHHGNPDVYVRSLATRGALGGLSEKAMEISKLMKNAGFDWVILETVGVGQSEVEVASLADTTILVLVPGAGDDVQMLKSGIMEIADIFVVNKADRDGADMLVKNIYEHLDLRQVSKWIPPVVKTEALKKEGIKELIEKIEEHTTRTP